jgi:TIR domain
MASIFISYRREDTGGHAGRLCDRLTDRFGGDRVFMDIQDIHPGQNFATSIEDTIATCDCVVAVIGPRWLETVQKRAQSRDDFVRHEIGSALKRHVTVIPVLMGGARMPAAADLPPELAELSVLNAIEVRDERFDQDVVELETFLASKLRVGDLPAAGTRARLVRRLRVAIPLLVIAAIAGYFLLRPGARMAGDAPVPAAPVIDGEWVAEMQKPGQPPFRIRLSFQRVGESIGGMVQYPTGNGAMHEVTLKGRTLTFYTSHVPQFESSPATIRFQAEVAADRIQLMATDDAGVATGVAARPASRQRP